MNVDIEGAAIEQIRAGWETAAERAEPRFVVTGIGLITAHGVGARACWDALSAGQPGIAGVRRFALNGGAARAAAELPEQVFAEINARLRRRQRLESSLFAQLGVLAAMLAVEDGGLDLAAEDRSRIGVIIGTGTGGGLALESRLARCNGELSPRMGDVHGIVHTMTNAAVGTASVALGIEGPSLATTGITAGADAFTCALTWLQLGRADVVLVGAAEAALSPCALEYFDRLGILSHAEPPVPACRPFDRARDGGALGDGAAVLLVETAAHAARRAARPVAELCGYGRSGPCAGGPAEAMAQAMTAALSHAAVRRDAVDLVSACALATQEADRAETAAIRAVFGRHAQGLAVTAPKSMIGHTLGAAGAIETAIATLSLRHSLVPPTINYETPDPACDLYYTPNRALSTNLRYGLVNCFGSDGSGTSLLLRRIRPHELEASA